MRNDRFGPIRLVPEGNRWCLFGDAEQKLAARPEPQHHVVDAGYPELARIIDNARGFISQHVNTALLPAVLPGGARRWRSRDCRGQRRRPIGTELRGIAKTAAASRDVSR